MSIRSVIKAKTNGELLEIVQPLWFPSYDSEEWLDCTFGPYPDWGNWWTTLTAPCYLSDITAPEGSWDDIPCVHPWDYRRLPLADATLDGVFADPPYAPPGGRETSTVKEMHRAYGMGGMPATPKGTFLDHRRLMMEAGRVVKPKGRLVFKCSDFITSGRYWSGLGNVLDSAGACGWYVDDLVVHESGPGPQPKSRMVKCPSCKGSGWPTTDEVPCPTCEGTGKVEKETDQQHTRRVHSYLCLLVRESWR